MSDVIDGLPGVLDGMDASELRGFRMADLARSAARVA
jgi:hypothetical protein